jgi:GDP-L-fucose synthase
MKILVTGATGFLGTALCRRLEQQGHEIVRLHSKNCDLRRGESLEQFSSVAYDQIYHLAAWTQAGDFCVYHPGEQWIINQQINTHVLAWWQKRQPQAKLICMGTSCAYAPGSDLVEENYLVGLPIESLFTYAMTKRMLYVGLLALQKQFGLKHLCLVPSTLYGPGYHTDGRQMHFIFDLIRKILRGKLHGEPVVLWGDGHQTRELVYVEDFVNLALQLAGTCENDLINIGAGQEFSIRHFARLICEQVGYDFNSIQFDTSRYVGARSKCLSTRKLLGLIPNLQLTSLQTGLAHTIEWFQRENPAVLAKTPQ